MVLEYLKDPKDFGELLWYNPEIVEASDEILEVIIELGDPVLAYNYALRIENKPRDSTRRISCKKPVTAYLYARYVDKCKRGDTEKAASVSRYYAHEYKRHVPGAHD